MKPWMKKVLTVLMIGLFGIGSATMMAGCDDDDELEIEDRVGFLPK